MKFDDNVKTKSGGMFVKLKDGESVTGVLRGEFSVSYVVWEGGKTVAVDEDHPSGKFQAKVNLVVTENGALKAKILTVGGKLYDDLKELHKEGYDLEKTALKFKRTGTELKTKYSVVPVKDGAVTPEVETQLQTVTLQDLNRE